MKAAVQFRPELPNNIIILEKLLHAFCLNQHLAAFFHMKKLECMQKVFPNSGKVKLIN